MIGERKISTNSVCFESSRPRHRFLYSNSLTHTCDSSLYSNSPWSKCARMNIEHTHTHSVKDICLICSRNGTEHAILYAREPKRTMGIAFSILLRQSFGSTHTQQIKRFQRKSQRLSLLLLVVLMVPSKRMCARFWLWFMKESANGRKQIIISPFLDLCLISEIFWFVTRNCWYCYHLWLY